MERRHPSLTAAIALLCALAFSAGTARAQAAAPVPATMHVSLEVLPNCRVAAEPLTFGMTNPDGSRSNATASIEVTCGPGVAFTVALDDGRNPGGGTRRALDQATGLYVAYDIFADAGCSRRWGASGTQAISGLTTASGTARLTAYGQLRSSTPVSAGRFGDVVTVTAMF